MQFTALEPIRRTTQSDRGIASNSAVTPTQSRSTGSGNNFATNQLQGRDPCYGTVAETSGTITTNLNRNRAVRSASSMSSRNPILVKKRIATKAVAGGNAISSTIRSFRPTYPSAVKARMRSSVVIANIPQSARSFRSGSDAADQLLHRPPPPALAEDASRQDTRRRGLFS